MMRNWMTATAAISLVAGGCATTPAVTLGYYLPKGEMQTSVSRTVGCNSDNTVFVTNTVTNQVAYSADHAAPQTIDLDGLDAAFVNAQLDFSFTEDGRLSGLNTTQIGQGPEIVTALMQVADLALPAAAGDDARKNACEYIRAHGKEGVMTLEFSAFEDFSTVPRWTTVQPTNETLFNILAPLLGTLCQSVAAQPNQMGGVVGSRSADNVRLNLRRPASVLVLVASAPGGECENPTDAAVERRTPIWRGVALVPQRGTDYWLPIPRPALFGQQTFSVTIAESGAVTELKYGDQSGVAGALDAATAIGGRLQGDTDAEVAARANGEADRIVAQQRLIRCRIDPSTCS